MKKILLVILFLCLVANPILAVTQTKGIPDMKRIWQCLTTPDKSECTKAERNKAKTVLTTTAVGALVVALAAIGITTVKAKQIYDMKEEDKQMKAFAESGKDLSFYPRLEVRRDKLLESLDAIKEKMTTNQQVLNNEQFSYPDRIKTAAYIGNFHRRINEFNKMTTNANNIIDQLRKLEVTKGSTIQELRSIYRKYKTIIGQLYTPMPQEIKNRLDEYKPDPYSAFPAYEKEKQQKLKKWNDINKSFPKPLFLENLRE